MSERLTSSGKSISTSPIELAFPAALILVAFFSKITPQPLGGNLSFVDGLSPADYAILFSGVAVLFALQCGILLRGMLPQKAPAAHKALTSTLGALTASLPLTFSDLDLLIPWTLALTGWTVFTNFDSRLWLPRIKSGLCIGLSFSLNVSTIVVAASVFIATLFSLKQPDRKIRQAAGVWILALLVGLIPLFLNVFPAPQMPLTNPEVEPVLRQLTELLSSMNWIILPFLLLGTGVACFQCKRTFFGLCLPILFGLPLITLGFGTPESLPILYLPIALLSGYGLFRIVRGIEQGIRNVNSSTARAFVPATTVLSLVSYAAFLALTIISF